MVGKSLQPWERINASTLLTGTILPLTDNTGAYSCFVRHLHLFSSKEKLGGGEMSSTWPSGLFVVIGLGWGEGENVAAEIGSTISHTVLD